jgi:hypothetical protein
VDFAAKHKVWIVLVMHEVEQGGRQYSFSPQNLEKVLQYIKSSNVKAVTVANGLKAIRQAQHQQSLTLASKVP